MRYERSQAVAAAQSILDRHGWCVYEVCVNVPEQLWESRVLFFDLTAAGVADAVEAEIQLEPEHDGRLTGCDRRGLYPEATMGSYLVYVADDSLATYGRG